MSLTKSSMFLFSTHDSSFKSTIKERNKFSKSTMRGTKPQSASSPRKQNRRTCSIDPELAARVAKEYVLPIYRAELRRQSRRSKDGSRPLEAPDKTVMCDLKLSEQLYQEISKLKKSLEEKDQKLKEVEQNWQLSQKEIENVKENLLNSQNDKMFSYLENSNLQKINQNLLHKNNELVNKVSEYTKQVTELEKIRNKFSKQLLEEKSINDKLKFRATQLEHQNSLFAMQNAVMGERLKGLYESVNQITGTLGMQNKLESEVKSMAFFVSEIANYFNSVNREAKLLVATQEELQKDCLELTQIKDKLEQTKNTVINSVNYKIKNLKDEITKLRIDKQELGDKIKELENSIQFYCTENSILKNQLKSFKSVQNRFEEKQCIKCNKRYSENSNFNWSCKTHKSEYSEAGGIYFCCGKKQKDSKGCITSKHVSKEDEEASEENKTDANRCTNCKDAGHLSHECPKDPNFQSEADPIEEMKRLENLKSGKKASLGFGFKERLYNLIGDKKFNSLDPSDSLRIFEDLEELKKEFKSENYCEFFSTQKDQTSQLNL